MIDVVNLVIGKLIGKVVYVGIVDFDCVFVVVQCGFEVWCKVFVYECVVMMCKVVVLVCECVDMIVQLMMQEQGKLFIEVCVEVLLVVDIIEWFVDEGCCVYGWIVLLCNFGVQQMVVKELVGLVVVFMLWNFLVNQVVCKLSVVFVIGCLFFVKVLEEILVLLVVLLCVFVDVGVLVGVIGFVYGDLVEILLYLILYLVICKVMFMGLMLVGK